MTLTRIKTATWKASVSRARSAPAEAMIRAKILLSVAAGMTYQESARSAGRKSGDAVSALVSRFNQEGLNALVARQGGGGFQQQYGPEAQARILRGFSASLIPSRMERRSGH